MYLKARISKFASSAQWLFKGVPLNENTYLPLLDASATIGLKSHIYCVTKDKAFLCSFNVDTSNFQAINMYFCGNGLFYWFAFDAVQPGFERPHGWVSADPYSVIILHTL